MIAESDADLLKTEYGRKWHDKLSSARTITGKNLALTLVNGKLRVENSRFLFANTEASNGVIHAIYPAINLK
jgi:uncharacterized surface protein with fasciclin (FAS1) repeats